MNKQKTLILGIGNEILTDDGIGVKLCDYLKKIYDHKSIQFENLNVGGLEVLEFINGYDTVVFIDAIKTVNGKVGDVYLFTPSSFKETLHLSNLHDINFITALELGKSLDIEIPKKMFIIAIEIKEDMVFSDVFTIELESRYSEVKKTVEEHLRHILPNIV